MKKPQKKTQIQELSDRLQTLMSKRLAAYRAGASYQIMEQIDNMIAETQLDLYTESELQRHREGKDQDGESFIV
jgi:hypothetical protein